MKQIDEKRRVPAPGGASPRGLLPAPAGRAEESLRRDFRWHAGQVLARRNRRDLKAAAEAEFLQDMGLRPMALLRRVTQRQQQQFELFTLAKGGAR